MNKLNFEKQFNTLCQSLRLRNHTVNIKFLIICSKILQAREIIFHELHKYF